MKRGEAALARDFYPMVEKSEGAADEPETLVTAPARIAVYDDASAAPRVVVVEPKDVRAYLEEITATVSKLAREQGGSIPFMVIREIVENFIHAYFQSPTITILDGGNTIRFSDQGPGIREKDLALEFGTSSATEEMRRYIRGVGSGLPYAQQYMEDKGGSLTIEDNIAGGTVVTISVRPSAEARGVARSAAGEPQPQAYAPQAVYQQGWPQQGSFQQAPGAYQQMPGYQQGAGGYAQAPGFQQPGYQQAPRFQQQPYYQQQAWQQPGYQQPWQQDAAQQAWQQPGYQQPGAMPAQGAAMQEAAGQPAMAQAAAQQAPAGPQLGERGQMVIGYLAQHESVGPTDLIREYGFSGPTWSRELASLAAAGYIMKSGQKYQLTAVGRGLI